MSKHTKKIGLKATNIRFNDYSIIYDVKPIQDIDMSLEYPIYAPDDCVDKELILKQTLLSTNSMSVIYTPSNVTPSFFIKIANETLHDLDEHKHKFDRIYNVGEIVGYILL